MDALEQSYTHEYLTQNIAGTFEYKEALPELEKKENVPFEVCFI